MNKLSVSFILSGAAIAATAQGNVQPNLGVPPAQKPPASAAPAPTSPAPAPQAAAQRPQAAAPAVQAPPAQALKSPASPERASDDEARRRARGMQLERLDALDLQIEEARKVAELAAARERISPGFQMPNYLAVYGLPGKMKAVLVSSNGGQMTVGQGDRIASGVVVSMISSEGVELAVGQAKGSAKRIALTPATTQTASPAPMAPPLVPGQPGMVQPTPLPVAPGPMANQSALN